MAWLYPDLKYDEFLFKFNLRLINSNNNIFEWNKNKNIIKSKIYLVYTSALWIVCTRLKEKEESFSLFKIIKFNKELRDWFE